MSDLLSIGASGISAYRSALSVIGDNVANAQTDGYARRSITLTQSIASFGADPLSINRSSAGGVTQGQVVRAWDDFRASESRVSQADAGSADARARWLSNIETAIDDGPTGTGVALTTFYNSATALAADPTGTSPRGAFMSALGAAAASLNDNAGSLTRAATGITAEAASATETLNGNLKSLAQVNDALRRAVPGSASSTNLADTRDQLLDSISKAVGVDVALDANGAATVKLAGSSDVTLVDSNIPASVTLTPADDGRLSLTLVRNGELKVMQPASGALAGLIDVAATTAGRRADLDAIATGFAKSVNDFQTAGRTPAGVPGAALLTGSGAADLALVTQSGSAIAAASSDGVANGNLATLQASRANGAEGQLAAIVTAHALATSAAKAESAAAATRRDNAFAARDEVSGVDLDKEAAELLRYQQAYSGSAKLIQIAKETLQSVLNLF